jgi:hypothetical protein
LRSERGDSDFDVRQNFNFSALYELPFGKTGSRMRKALLGGYQINAIFTAHTGLPWTPVTGQSARRGAEPFTYAAGRLSG